MNIQSKDSVKDFLIDEVLRDYSNNSKDHDVLGQISMLKHEIITRH